MPPEGRSYSEAGFLYPEIETSSLMSRLPSLNVVTNVLRLRASSNKNGLLLSPSLFRNLDRAAASSSLPPLPSRLSISLR
jgi:hypothetical protein